MLLLVSEDVISKDGTGRQVVAETHKTASQREPFSSTRNREF